MRQAIIEPDLPRLTYFAGDKGEILHFLSKEKTSPVWNELKKFQRQVLTQV